MILDIEDYIKPERPKLYVATPNKTIVGELPEAYNTKLNTKLGNVSTLEFSIPYQITKLNKLIDNPNVKKTKNRYLIKYVHSTNVEWFMIKNPSDVMDDNDHKDIQCFGLAHELANKNIRNYEVTSKNATQILNDILASSLWNIGTIQADFDTMYRSISVSDSNVLDVIFDVAATFNALVMFDSENRKINFVQFDEHGSDKGLEVSYGNLLKNAARAESSDEFFTLFKGFGADGIGIQGVNVTGSNYLMDFSYFLYPFARDEHGVVLSHSDYMSDSLAGALLDFQELLEAKSGTYQGYLSTLETLNETLITRQNELFDLQAELANIEDQIAVANYNKQSTVALVEQKNFKTTLITSKNGEVAAVQGSIAAVNSNIKTLQDSLAMSENFTAEQLEELNPYIIEGSYENTNITSAQQLYDILLEEFDKVKQPKIVVEIGMVNLLEIVEEKKKWNMLFLGDTMRIKNTKIGIDVKAKIIELNTDFESGEISVVISNIKELLSDEERFLKDLYNAKTTTTNVISGSNLWNKAADDASGAQQILNGIWDATARRIQASVDNTVDIGRKGVIVRDPNTPDDILILQKGLLAISRNGGNTWSTAINADGVFAERLVGQILVGTNLSISNSSGSVSITDSGMTVTDMTLSIIRSDTKSRILMNATNGLKIQANTGTVSSPVWTDRLSADSAGNLILTGALTTGTGASAVRADTNGFYIGNSNFSSAPVSITPTGNATFNGTVTATNVDVRGGRLGWGNWGVNSAGELTATGANISGNVTANAIVANTFIQSPTIYGGNISGSSININNKFTVNGLGAVTARDITITGGNITGASNINVTTNVMIGNQLILSDTNFGNGIKWGDWGGPGTDGIEIYIDPGGSLLQLHTPSGGGGIWANSRRIDIAQPAVFA